MTQAVLNTQLYQKMFAEQAHFKDWLLTQTPEEVLNHAYEYTCREDILLSLEYNDLSPRQAKALLKSPTPLADVFKKWDSWDDNWQHCSTMWMIGNFLRQPPRERRMLPGSCAVKAYRNLKFGMYARL